MSTFSRRQSAATGFVAIVLLLGVLLASGRARLSTDIFELLPETRRDALVAQAIEQARGAFFDKVTAVIALPADGVNAEALAARARAALAAAPLEPAAAGEQARALQAFYLQHPYEWLTPQDRAALEQDARRSFRDNLGIALARPGGFDMRDPAGYVSRFMAALPAPDGDWTLVAGLPARLDDGAMKLVLNARVTADPLDPAVQRAVSAAFDDARRAIAEQCESCSLQWTGAIRFSQATREAAETDVTRLSAAATLGILLLFALTFRALRPLLAAVAVVTASVLAGLTASFAVFGEIHVLTLVFGTTLLGICVDYVLHFLVHRWAHPGDSGTQALAAIAPGLRLGLATSASAFLFLLFAGFPALSQLAVFSLAGLCAAFALVHLWLPDAAIAPRRDNALARWVLRDPRVTARVRFIALAIILAAACVGLPRVEVVDDIRGLQAAPVELLEDDKAVRAATLDLPGDTGSADFVLVQAADLDTALRREHALLSAYPAGGFGLSRFLPPAEERAASSAAYAALFADNARPLRALLDEFAFHAAAADDLADRYARSNAQPADSNRMLESPAFAALRALHVQAGEERALITRLPGDLEELPPLPGLRVIRPLQEIESTFAAVRTRGGLAVAAAYLLMLLILMRRYGAAGGALALAPALSGAFAAAGLLGLAGLPLNVFSLVGLVLVLGIGADYALFLREGARDPRAPRAATLLAAATSLLSFGLLAFSSLAALRAFGVATGAGILVAFIAAPLALLGNAPIQRQSAAEDLDRAA